MSNTYTPEEIKKYESKLTALKISNGMKFDKTSEFAKYIQTYRANMQNTFDLVKKLYDTYNKPSDVESKAKLTKVMSNIGKDIAKETDLIGDLIGYLSFNNRLTDDI
jgi:hypothetical protein